MSMSNALTFKTLRGLGRIALSDRYWLRLTDSEKVIFRAAILHAKERSRTVNKNIVNMLLDLIDGFNTSLEARIIRLDLTRATETHLYLTLRRVIQWHPKFKERLLDVPRIFHLGLISPKTIGYDLS